MQQVESRSRRNPSSQFHHHHHHHRGDDGLVNIYYISISRMSFGFVFRKLVNVIKISLSAITFLLILAAEARCKPSSPSYKNKHFSLFEKVLLKPDRQTRGKKKKRRRCGTNVWNWSVATGWNRVGCQQFQPVSPLKTSSCPIWCLECPSERRPTQGRPDGCGPAPRASPLAGGTRTRSQISLSRPH